MNVPAAGEASATATTSVHASSGAVRRLPALKNILLRTVLQIQSQPFKKNSPDPYALIFNFFPQ